MSNIPFFTFQFMNEDIREEMISAFTGFFDSGWYVLGKGLERFEHVYAEYSGVRHSVGVSNGLEALVLSLKALDVKTGDEVIVPSNTYIATWLAITDVGAKIVPVEPREATFNIRAEEIKDKISERTKCIMPVHLFGQPCEMDGITELANRHELFVVEDNAQSQGATCGNKKTGSFGDINGVSFYPAKNLGALGEAGAITTDSEDLAQKVRVLRNYGSEKKYYNSVIGCNDRMDELQAWILEAKLRHLDKWNNERIAIATRYDQFLEGIGDLILPTIAAGVSSVYHQYVIRTKHRDALQSFLNKQGIGTLIHYPVPPHLQKAYAFLGFRQGDFPIAERLAKTALSIPLYPGLSTESQEMICDKISDFYNRL
jgi:dTDP-4-amino-4,6-dideoxygalactose transaminase